jgi:5'-nucleotidase
LNNKKWRKKMKKLFTLITALTFVFAVAGCKDDTPTGPTDAELVAEATTALLLTDLNEVTSTLTLPASGLHSSVVTWSSSNTAVITNAGVVTRPAVGEDNAVVTLTATITIGDASDTKEFTARVIAAVPTLDVTIADFNTDAVSIDDDIVVTGVVFGIVEGGGFHVSDGTAFVFVYAGTSEGVALGDTVKVTGQKTIYYGLPEVDTVTSVEVLSSGDAQPDYEVLSIIDLFDEDPFDTMYWSAPITITGLVSVDGDGNAVLTATSAEGMAYNIVVYYKSFPAQITSLVALAGEMVTVDVIVYGYHDGLGAWRVVVAEDATITSETPTDAEIALWEAGQLDLGMIDEVNEDIVLNTVGELAGTTISWASDNEAVISPAGVVTRTAGANETVTLTATITVGTETFVKEFVATVMDANLAIEFITVAEAIASPVDTDPITVKGIVTAIIGSSKIVLQDAVGGPGITTYHSGFNNDNEFAIGDEIILQGTHEIYYGLQELTGLTLLSVVSSDNPVQMATDITVAELVADLAEAPYALQGVNAVLTDLVVVDDDYDAKSGYIVVADDLGNEFIFSAYDVSYSDTYVVGDTISELTVVIWDFYYSAPRVIVTAFPAFVSTTPDIFFSEYIEGTSNNKAIEIYNPTGADVLLDGYVINYYNNGSAEVTKSFDLTGITLVAGDVYVICTDSYAGPAVCDEIQAYGDEDSVVFFNGDDAMELVKNGVAIDVIGKVGQEGDDGAAWFVDSVDELGAPIMGETNEFTLVRAPGVVLPNGVFTPSEWIVYPQDTFTELGSHTVD